MTLREYKKKRSFQATPEPMGKDIPHRDQYASTKAIASEEPRSVSTKRLLADIARDEHGDITKAATGDPEPVPRRPARRRNPATAKNPARKHSSKPTR